MLQSALLLLMEAVAQGAYERAMRKRGPGLHHIAIDVENLEEYLAKVQKAGWLLHPHSHESIARKRTAYMYAPGMPTLIEVLERNETLPKPSLIRSVELSILPKLEKSLVALELKELRPSPDQENWLTMKGHRLSIQSLI